LNQGYLYEERATNRLNYGTYLGEGCKLKVLKNKALKIFGSEMDTVNTILNIFTK
jgi:hypothetical protein